MDDCLHLVATFLLVDYWFLLETPSLNESLFFYIYKEERFFCKNLPPSPVSIYIEFGNSTSNRFTIYIDDSQKVFAIINEYETIDETFGFLL